MLRVAESQRAAAVLEQFLRVFRASVALASAAPPLQLAPPPVAESSASRPSWKEEAALVFFLPICSVQLDTLLAILRWLAAFL